MGTETKKKKSDSWWARLLISIIGTAIGVGLTFAVNDRRDNLKKEQAQRLMAIMVIHDIDETINSVKDIKERIENYYNATRYVWEHIDQMDSISRDTLGKALSFITTTEEDLRFDMSKEKIFHSSPDVWQNLGSMKFIDNVQSFFYDRQSFQDAYNKSTKWQGPVTLKDLERLKLVSTNKNLEEYYENYYSVLRELLKEKLSDGNVIYFIESMPSQIASLVTMIEKWTKMNDENKFLMSITDEELDNYVHNINQNGTAITEKSLIGTWSASLSDESSSDWEFRKDHTFALSITSSRNTNVLFAQGKSTIVIIETGSWAIKEDTLIKTVDSIDVKIDVSEMSVEPGKQELLDNWHKEYQDHYSTYYQKMSEENKESKYQARLDASNDKMELRTKNGAGYYKRKKIF